MLRSNFKNIAFSNTIRSADVLRNLKASLYLKNIIHVFEDIAIFWHRYRGENMLVRDKKRPIFHSEQLTQITIFNGNQTPAGK